MVIESILVFSLGFVAGVGSSKVVSMRLKFYQRSRKEWLPVSFQSTPIPGSDFEILS